MRLTDLIEMSQKDIEISQGYLARKFLSIGIILVFAKHFGDRIIDGAKDEHGKRDNVTLEDLASLFSKLYAHHKRIFAQASQFTDEVKRGEFEGVIKDMIAKTNVPFGLEFNKSKGKYVMTCTTIMKKDNFHVRPTDHVVEV